MPELKLIPLQETMTDDDIQQLEREIAEISSTSLPDVEDSYELDDELTDDQLTDFMDRLEAHDIACDVYLPIEFDGRLEVAERSFGSAHTLLEALEELRDELDIDQESGSSSEDEIDLEVIEEQLSYAWHLFARGANGCVTQLVPLHILP